MSHPIRVCPVPAEPVHGGRRRPGAVAIAVLATILAAGAVRAQSVSVTQQVQRTLPAFTVRQATLGHAMTLLHTQGVPVCYEQLNRKPEGSREVIRPPVNLDLANATVGSALDAIVANAGAYRWETHEAEGVVNVLPLDSYAEKLRLNVSAKGQGLLDVVWRGDLHLEESGIYLVHDGPWLPNPPVTLNMQNATLKDVLNALVAQAPGWAWQLVGVEGRRSLTFTYWGSE